MKHSKKAVKRNVRILWVDDLIDVYDEHILALQSFGYVVDGASCPIIALEQYGKKKYDVVLVDFVMPGMEGDEFLGIAKIKWPDANFAILSSFLYQEGVREKLERIDDKVFVMDKDLGRPGTTKFDEAFVSQLVFLESDRPKLTPKDFFDKVEESADKDPFKIGYDTFHNVPSFVQEILGRQAYSKASDLLEDEFAKGTQYVVLCGSRVKPLQLIPKGEELPPTDQLEAIAKSKGHPYYIFRNFLNSDDSSPLNSCTAGDETVYPTVTLQGAGSSENRFNLHFDTGTNDSLFDYEFALVSGFMIEEGERVFITQRKSVGNTRRRAKVKQQPPLTAYEFTQDLYLIGQADSASTRVQIKGLSIKGWWSSRWARTCSVNCAFYLDCSKDMNRCKHRRALIGRRIVADNQSKNLSLIIHGDNNQISFTTNFPDILGGGKNA